MQWISPEVYKRHNVKFLRQENLVQDFQTVFSDIIDTNTIDLRSKVNSAKPDIEGASIIALNQKKIYQNCPYWSGLEFIVYGNTLAQT